MRLMSGRRQKTQLELAFAAGCRGEAPRAADGGTEPLTAKRGTEGPASTALLMEEVCESSPFSRRPGVRRAPGCETTSAGCGPIC